MVVGQDVAAVVDHDSGALPGALLATEMLTTVGSAASATWAQSTSDSEVPVPRLSGGASTELESAVLGAASVS